MKKSRIESAFDSLQEKLASLPATDRPLSIDQVSKAISALLQEESK